MENQGKSLKICIVRKFFGSLYTSMEPCIVRILHSAENFAFWTLWRTKQGPTVVNQFEFRVNPSIININGP